MYIKVAQRRYVLLMVAFLKAMGREPPAVPSNEDLKHVLSCSMYMYRKHRIVAGAIVDAYVVMMCGNTGVLPLR